jgi:2,3-bisphosphoglycerate-dependent phosphoglycerate mutase
MSDPGTRPVTRLVYVRHGESNSTVSRTIAGFRTCTGLSPLGVQQAERLRDRWRANPEIEPARILTSHFARAKQTAEIIGTAFPGVPIEEDERFGEHDPGPDCDGMAMSDFVAAFGTESWEDDPFGVTFPGGETLALFHYRVGAAIRSLVDDHPDQTVLVVCHGGVIDAAMRHALRTPSTGAFLLWTVNTSITEFTLSRPNKWVLRRYNDAAHLAGLPASSLVS